MKPAVPLLVLALALLAVSCKVGPNYTTPTAKVAGQWQANPAVTNQAYSTAEEYWWRNFHDSVLDQLVETAFRNNLSLQVAGVRILEARAKLNKSIGNLFPQQQNLSRQLNYTRLDDGLVTAIPGIDRNYLSDQVLFAATWEIDFWGKYRRAIESDRAAYLGTIASYDDALVTLIGDVASSYVNIRTLEERLRVARRNVELQQESLRIASVRFKGGETSERDVQQATTQLGQTESQIPQLEQAVIQNKDGLALLLGQTPDEIDRHLTGPSRIPTAPATVVAGIPRDLLRRRPDVRAAGLAAASQSALIGVAKATMYPSFSLGGQSGVTGNNEGNNSLSDMFNWQSRALSAGSGFVFPIFNYGRLINQVRVQDAEFQGAVLNYQNTVVNAEQSQLAVENSLASTQGNVVLGIISVYRALGGGWQIRAGHDVISDEVKAEMARRTDWGRLLEPGRHLPASLPPKDVTQAKERQ